MCVENSIKFCRVDVIMERSKVLSKFNGYVNTKRLDSVQICLNYNGKCKAINYLTEVRLVRVGFGGFAIWIVLAKQPPCAETSAT